MAHKLLQFLKKNTSCAHGEEYYWDGLNLGDSRMELVFDVKPALNEEVDIEKLNEIMSTVMDKALNKLYHKDRDAVHFHFHEEKGGDLMCIAYKLTKDSAKADESDCVLIFHKNQLKPLFKLAHELHTEGSRKDQYHVQGFMADLFHGAKQMGHRAEEVFHGAKEVFRGGYRGGKSPYDK